MNLVVFADSYHNYTDIQTYKQTDIQTDTLVMI